MSNFFICHNDFINRLLQLRQNVSVRGKGLNEVRRVNKGSGDGDDNLF